MSCIKPLIAYPKGVSEKGKTKYIPVPRSGHEEIYDSLLNAEHREEWLAHQQKLYRDGKIDAVPKIVPCGKCIGCRLDYSRNWAYRCLMELEYHKEAYFLTLTYNDEMIPVHYFYEKGEKLPAYSLEKRDFQLWLKRLRKQQAKLHDNPIRFFGCGEYGSDTLRPHYHCIVYGLHLDDLKIYKRTDQGILYTSEKLNRTWIGQRHRGEIEDEPYKYLGFVVIGQVTFNTAAYVARYTAKKAMTVGNEFFDKFNLEKPFIDMSRRPGIGLRYFEDHPELFNNDMVHFAGKEKGYSFNMPKYFLEKLEVIDNDLFNRIKKEREIKGNVYALAIARSQNRPYSDVLRSAEMALVCRAKALQREF